MTIFSTLQIRIVNHCLLVRNDTQFINACMHVLNALMYIYLNVADFFSPLHFVGGIGIVLLYRKFKAFIHINNSQAIKHLIQTFMVEIQKRLC